MTDRAKVFETIVQLARGPDGRLDPRRVTNRLIRRASGANTNVVCAVLREWRLQMARQSDAVPESINGSGEDAAPRRSSRSPANKSTARPSGREKRQKKWAGPPELAPEFLELRRDAKRLLASLDSLIASRATLQSAATKLSSSELFDQAADPHNVDKRSVAAAPESYGAGTSAPRPNESKDSQKRPSERRRSEDFALGKIEAADFDLPGPIAQAAGQVAGILAAGGPLMATQVFDELPQETKRAVSRRHAQELLRLASTHDAAVRRLPDGRWCYGHVVVVVGRQRAMRARSVQVRKSFANFACDLLQREGRPFAAVEIYDRYAKLGTPDFVRNWTSGILSTANHPELVKLLDGSWWLAGRPVPETRPRGGYHSRVRAPCYGELARHVASALRSAGRPMSGPELLRSIPAALRERLPSHNIHESLQFAQRENPQLFRRPDRTWWLAGVVANGAPICTKRDRLAAETIAVLRVNGPLRAREIRRFLPDDLSAAFPSIRRPLEELRSRLVLHFEAATRLWSLGTESRDAGLAACPGEGA